MSHISKLVDNDQIYWEFIRHLRNNADVKKGFIEQIHIDKDEHLAFMRKHSKGYKVALNAFGAPIGFVGMVNGDIRIAVSPTMQGKGVGKFMLEKFLAEHSGTIRAKVKVENKKSLALFESLGFKKKFYIMEKE